MAALETLQDIIKMAIAIDKATDVYVPSLKCKRVLAPDYCTTGVGKGYNVSNNVLVFAIEDISHVIPYSQNIENLLKENGFVKRSMYVPFADGEYPVVLNHYWEHLLKLRDTEKL